VTTYQSVQDVPEDELMYLEEALEFNATQARVLCEYCHPRLLGAGGDPGSVAHHGQECARCGGVRDSELSEQLAHARDALVDARLAGATAADVATVLRSVRYLVALERCTRGEGPTPSALGMR